MSKADLADHAIKFCNYRYYVQPLTLLFELSKYKVPIEHPSSIPLNTIHRHSIEQPLVSLDPAIYIQIFTHPPITQPPFQLKNSPQIHTKHITFVT